MPSATTWLAFALATLAMLLLPGPSVLYVMACGAHRGVYVGLAGLAAFT